MSDQHAVRLKLIWNNNVNSILKVSYVDFLLIPLHWLPLLRVQYQGFMLVRDLVTSPAPSFGHLRLRFVRRTCSCLRALARAVPASALPTGEPRGSLPFVRCLPGCRSSRQPLIKSHCAPFHLCLLLLGCIFFLQYLSPVSMWIVFSCMFINRLSPLEYVSWA